MNLKQKTISGLTWSGIGTGSKLISQFITTAILARYLSPTDFGLVAMAMVFTEFASIFSDMGISSALIQKKDATEGHYSSAFWLNIIVGLALTLSMILVSPLVMKFYDRPQLQPILIALSFNFILSSLTIIQQTLLNKNLEFKKLTLRDIIAVLGSSVIGIFLALKGYGVWSLVWQTLSFTVMNAVLLWTLSSWRPCFIFSIPCIKDIFKFGSHVLGSSLLYYFRRNTDKLLIGKFLGTPSLGLYSLAYKIMMYPLHHVTWVVNKVMFPVFSKMQEDLPKLQNTYCRLLKTVSLITFPLMSGFIFIAPDFIHTIYGSQWEPVVFLIRILCVSGLFLSVSSVTIPIYLACGRSDLKLKMDIVSTALLIGSIVFGMQWGLKGIVVAYTLYEIVWEHFFIFLGGRVIKMNFWKAYSNMLPAYSLSFIVIIVMYGLKHYLSFSGFSGLFLFVVISGIIYGSLLLMIKVISIKNKKIVFNL